MKITPVKGTNDYLPNEVEIRVGKIMTHLVHLKW